MGRLEAVGQAEREGVVEKVNVVVVLAAGFVLDEASRPGGRRQRSPRFRPVWPGANRRAQRGTTGSRESDPGHSGALAEEILRKNRLTIAPSLTVEGRLPALVPHSR